MWTLRGTRSHKHMPSWKASQLQASESDALSCFFWLYRGWVKTTWVPSAHIHFWQGAIHLYSFHCPQVARHGYVSCEEIGNGAEKPLLYPPTGVLRKFAICALQKLHPTQVYNSGCYDQFKYMFCGIHHIHTDHHKKVFAIVLQLGNTRMNYIIHSVVFCSFLECPLSSMASGICALKCLKG